MPSSINSDSLFETSVLPFGDRSFGLELEIVGLNCTEAADALRLAGIDCRSEDYNHAVRSWWKTVTDASIVDNRNNNHYSGGRCCEVVSPILSGESGLEQVVKVCRALQTAGATVNKTTGMHVHINARDLNGRDGAVIATRYAKHESIIDSFMPKSRRSNNNHYCQSLVHALSETNRDNLERARTIRDILQVISNRGSKVNFEAYLRHGTIEFRQHSGTVNAEKVVNWIRFCQNFVSTSVLIARAPIPQIVPVVSERAIVPRRVKSEVRLAQLLLRNYDYATSIGACARPISKYIVARELGVRNASVMTIANRLRDRVQSFEHTIHPQVIGTNRSFRIRHNYAGFSFESDFGVESLKAFLRANNESLEFVPLPVNVPAPVVNITLPIFDSAFLGLNNDTTSYFNGRIVGFQNGGH